MLYEKQFGFQTAHSTDHAIIQLVNEISKSFEEDKFTLGVFIYRLIKSIRHCRAIKF